MAKRLLLLLLLLYDENRMTRKINLILHSAAYVNIYLSLSGIVTKVGDNVRGFKIGDKVGVGCISESCLSCSACGAGEEHCCENEYTGTYNGEIKHNLISTDTSYTYG